MKSQRRFSGVSVVLCLVTVSSQVLANPVGESLRAGRARFDRSAPGSLSIYQNSDKLIVNWREFSIAAGETTRFIQPSATSIALNRVVTANPSRLFGNLEANGKVYLINPSGILVGRGGAVNTRGFVASTLDVSDASFLSSAKLRLSGDSEASVVNEGSIQAIGGDVFLVGRTVENSGSIRAGMVGLGAGSEVVIVPTGRERLSVIAGNANGGQADKGVNNQGTIEAVSAELKAAGGNIYALAINNGGIIRANGVRREGGRVFLSSDGGNIENSGVIAANNANGSGGFVSLAGGHNDSAPSTVVSSGTIEARGDGVGTKGGEVRMTGDYVGLFGSSLIDVSGHSGGGTALIGGDYQGGNLQIQNAQRTFVDRDSRITADALVQGDGGKVVVWADEVTRFHGAISAQGGLRGGNGGFVETSGKAALTFDGMVQLAAPAGRQGLLLLDPTDLTITDTAAGTGSLDANLPFVAPGDGGASESVSRGSLEAIAANADITLQANRHITIDDLAGDVLNLLTGPGNTVTFRADADNNGTGDFTMATGDTIRTAGGAVVITGEDLTVGSIDTTGAGAVPGGATIGLNGQNMILGGSYTAGSSDITVAVRTGAANGDVLLGVASGTGLDLDSTDLDGFSTSGTVHFIAGAGGNVEVQGDVDFGALNIRLAAPDNISFQDGDTLTTTGNITLNAGTDSTGSILGNSDGIAHVVANIVTATTGTGDIGSSTDPLVVDANSLVASTAGAVGDNIFLLDTAGGLSALDINAGAGNATLTVAAGSVTDTDALVDITAANATVILNDATPQNFGSAGNRIGTDVNSLSVDTSTGGGDQFITEANGLTGLNLNAGIGDVALTLTLGGVADTDGGTDITADQATVVLSDAVARNFGASGDEIATSVNDLSVSTAAGGGNQFITEASGLTALDLNAAGGNVNLTLTLGALTDADGAADITAGNATVILSDATAQGFGSLANVINTSVGGLSVDTSAGGGSQFISEANGLTGLNLNAAGGDVNLTVILGGVADTDGGTDITAANAVIALNDTTAQNFGASGNRIGTSVDSLSVDTSAGGGSQFITEVNGLTALNLNAAGGDVNLVVTAGAVSDADGATDITADQATVTLSSGSAQDVGSLASPIGTSVNDLSVSTAGGGDQFITEANGLTALNLNAAGGNVNLTLTLGGITDADGTADITAVSATVTLQDVTAQAFGSLANPINTSVDALSVNTSAGGGDQFITEASGLTGLDLNAAGGDVNLTLTLGALADTDGATDITADQATVILSEAAVRNFGALANPIGTTVNDLSVSTVAGGGSQFITEANGLTALNLNAAGGNVNLTLTLGALTDTDAAADITAANATVILSDATAQGFGSLANVINTSVGGLSVDTSAGGGSQFISEANGLTGLNLNAAGGDVNLTLALGAIVDTDGATDITADQATVLLSDVTAQGFGSGANSIATSVNDLKVTTAAGGGDQFITEANGLTALELNAGAGDVNLTLTLGGVTDTDATTDITAGDLIVTLSDPAAQDFGSVANAIQTSVGTLSVDTSVGDGSQFIREANGLTGLNLNADGGSVNLTLAAGSLLDTDGATDIDALNVSVGAIGAGGSIGAAANPIEIDASGTTVTLDARGGTGSGVHVEVAQAGDITFTDSLPSGTAATETKFTRGTVTFDTLYSSDLTIRANGNMVSALPVGTPLLVPGTLTLNAVGAGSSIGGGIANPFAIDVGTLNASAGAGLSFSAANNVTLGGISTVSGAFFIQAGNTLTLNDSTVVNAGVGGTAILVANGIPGISVAGTPSLLPRFLIYALNAELTDPLVILNNANKPTIGALVADEIDSPRNFNPATPDPFGDSLNYFIFSLEANPPTDPSLFIDIPVEVFQPVSIVFGDYDPTKFGEVGDLWMSSSELYEIERKAGKARKAFPPQVNRAKYTPEAN